MAVLTRLLGALGALGAVAWVLTRLGGAPWSPRRSWPATPRDVPAWLAAGPPDERLVSLAVLAAWACVGWLAFVLLAVAAGAFPSGSVRDAAERVLGIAVVGAAAGALVAGPAVAADGPFDRPAGSPPSPPARAAAPVPGTPHVVARGDTLWGIAARRLGAPASPSLIAATWPRWHAANRPLIGPDPHRIRPGQRLVPPAVHDGEQR